VVLAGQLRGWSMAQTLSQASDFAGRICEVRGAVPADLDFYAAFGPLQKKGDVMPDSIRHPPRSGDCA